MIIIFWGELFNGEDAPESHAEISQCTAKIIPPKYSFELELRLEEENCRQRFVSELPLTLHLMCLGLDSAHFLYCLPHCL